MGLGRWTYGWRVTTSNQVVPFDRGGNFTATLRLGDYAPGQFAAEVQRAMRAADVGGSYTCTYNFSTRKLSFTNGGVAFALEWSRNASTNAAGLCGFDDVDTLGAATQSSTDTVGTASGYFETAGIYTWAPTDPANSNSPVTAAADGSAAALLPREALTVQQATDGGLLETIHYSTKKKFRIHYRHLSASGSPSEQTHMERLLNWIETGAPVNFQPDVNSTNALRLVLENPGELANAFSWLARTEVDYPELAFVEQLSRT